MRPLLLLSRCALFLFISMTLESAEPEAIKNTQDEYTPLLSPEDALAALQLPQGFSATLFAAEPDVRQPIGMNFDARGRLWIAENDTYSESAVGYDLNQKDRVIILEDSDGDGVSDSRKVFWEQGHHLTSVEVGFGGAWVLCAPDLLFIPDKNQDDIPDGEPVVMLTGFNADEIRHNIVNGLKWGPDGWLYGRHGITTTSFVGTLETPEELRTPLNCCIWRFHPITHHFEVVCRGTTNSWGHDWNEHGELFFINTVIGHLWHAVPGAHFERMFGQDFNPHLYRLMPQTADHYHWDQSEKWTEIRNGAEVTMSHTTDEAGGGHAHCGFMIYNGSNWPAEYRGNAFTVNLHGRRINRDALEREGAGYVGKHRPDVIASQDRWFRGVELAEGPDGSVYLLDWSDIGECHENDGIHRTSGRIFKVRFHTSQASPAVDLSKLTDPQLASRLYSEKTWQKRTARRLLQERAAAGHDLSKVRSVLAAVATGEADIENRLWAVWGLMSTGGVNDQVLHQIAHDKDEHLRVWALRILQERAIADPESLSKITDVINQSAEVEESGLALMYYAALLQRMAPQDQLTLGQTLLQKQQFADDPHYPLMVWYGIEQAVGAMPLESVALLAGCQLPEVQVFIARRIAFEHRTHADALTALIDKLSDAPDDMAAHILTGMKAAFDGLRKVKAPKNWQAVSTALSQREHAELTQLVRELSVTFGDGRAIEELRQIAGDGGEPFSIRSNAIQSLVTAKDAASRELLEKLVTDRDLGSDAIRGLAVIGNERTPELIVSRYNSLRGHIRPVAMETLASRPDYAIVLLEAVASKTISADEIPSFYLRQLRAFDHPILQNLLQQNFPELRHTSAEKQARVEQLRGLLTEQVLAKANASAGRVTFEKTCASCHKLYGNGGTLGPDLTGSQRSNLNYLLGNIVDPSAEVAEKFRMSIIALSDGRVISGVVLQQSEDTLQIQTPNETLTILKSDIDGRKDSMLSMMPERQLDQMTEEQIADLFAYLMSPGQVGLPR